MIVMMKQSLLTNVNIKECGTLNMLQFILSEIFVTTLKARAIMQLPLRLSDLWSFALKALPFFSYLLESCNVWIPVDAVLLSRQILWFYVWYTQSNTGIRGLNIVVLYTGWCKIRFARLQWMQQKSDKENIWCWWWWWRYDPITDTLCWSDCLSLYLMIIHVKIRIQA